MPPAIDITLQRFAEYHSLQGAFGRRALIEQAKGILMARHSINADKAFELLRETSPKNGYRFGISMEFAGADAYAAYNEHPDHVRFVQERWLSEVSDFLELDYAAR